MPITNAIPNFQFTNFNDGFVISISIVAKVGEENAVAKLLSDLVEPTMAEPGENFFYPTDLPMI